MILIFYQGVWSACTGCESTVDILPCAPFTWVFLFNQALPEGWSRVDSHLAFMESLHTLCSKAKTMICSTAIVISYGLLAGFAVDKLCRYVDKLRCYADKLCHIWNWQLIQNCFWRYSNGHTVWNLQMVHIQQLLLLGHAHLHKFPFTWKEMA